MSLCSVHQIRRLFSSPASCFPMRPPKFQWMPMPFEEDGISLYPVEDYQTKVRSGLTKERIRLKRRSSYTPLRSPNGSASIRITPFRHGPHLSRQERKGKGATAGSGSYFCVSSIDRKSSDYRTAGQRIDQTDLGLLIKNISHSLTDQRRGPVEIEEDGYVLIRVFSGEPFHEGVVTLYQFFIDKNLWLPLKVEDHCPRDDWKGP